MKYPAAYRSWLFVPGDRPERFAKALFSGAQAVILDLEDGVAEDKLSAAIGNVNIFLKDSVDAAPSLWVRVNDAVKRHPDIVALADHASLSGFVVPKCETAEQCQGWRKPVLALMETPLGIVNAVQTARAAMKELHGIALGPEDLCTALGIAPGRKSLQYAASSIIFAAHAAGLHAYACPGSIGDFKDLAAWRATLEAGRLLGSHGCLCIHPAQLAIADLVFKPNAAEIAWASAVCATWDAADGKGAIATDGKMIDRPVVARARALLARLAT